MKRVWVTWLGIGVGVLGVIIWAAASVYLVAAQSEYWWSPVYHVSGPINNPYGSWNDGYAVMQGDLALVRTECSGCAGGTCNGDFDIRDVGPGFGAGWSNHSVVRSPHCGSYMWADNGGMLVDDYCPDAVTTVTGAGGKIEAGDQVTLGGWSQWGDGTVTCTVQFLYYGEPPNTPTPSPIPSITPSPTPKPCDWIEVATGMPQVPETWYWPGGVSVSSQRIIGGDEQAVIVTGAETYVCGPGEICIIGEDTLLRPGEGLWCYQGCDTVRFEERPLYCLDPKEMPVLDYSSGITIVEHDALCMETDIAEFDLSALGLSLLIETLGLEVPQWGWYDGSWSICLAPKEITMLKIAGYDVTPQAAAILALFGLTVVGVVIRR